MGSLRFAKPRNSLPRQGQTFHEMESFKVFFPTFCTLQKVGKRSRRKAAVGCRRQAKKAAWPPEKRPRGGEKAHGVCCPEWGKLSERKVSKRI